ncbi:MAG: peptidoglycan editing factor PgeF [Desulfobacterota bacterium]|nr:peptidoglycan editing factor PgeF [Thermodesulfobacteriota bacterium]
MIEKTVSGLKLLLFENLAPYGGLTHAVTTRIGGVSPPPFHSLNLGTGTADAAENIEENYRRLAQALGFNLSSVVTSHQVHGDRIASINAIPNRQVQFPRAHALDGYDAFITDKKNIILMVRVADCVPIILYDPTNRVIALIHAGWRGTVASVALKTVEVMIRDYGCSPKTIRAGIGPSIGACCFSVRPDVAVLFHDRFGHNCPYIREASGTIYIDLAGLNWMQLQASGIRAEHIELSGICTACNLHLFFSHRGEQGKTGRFVLCAGLRV